MAVYEKALERRYGQAHIAQVESPSSSSLSVVLLALRDTPPLARAPVALGATPPQAVIDTTSNLKAACYTCKAFPIISSYG
ncbi:MAG: hypothetical protein M1820_007737 [Bogoriella megaspora]|nr:MAG: hypothetical protein M1820_007737 [Bogoriella megaspora]